MAIGTLEHGVAPPDILGLTVITVQIGQTLTINKASLMNSFPEYNQENNYDMSSLMINGFSNTSDILLAQTNTTNTIAYLSNTGNRIYFDGENIVNGVISMPQLTANALTVTGVKVGSSILKYVAKAANNANLESEYSEVEGKIMINVVIVNNLPPSNVGDGNQNVFNNALTTIQSSLFLNGYSDPENDLPENVRILSLPSQGTLIYNNVPVIVNQVISFLDINMGMLKYQLNVLDASGIYPFNFEVSDMGSHQYTS